MLHQARKQIEVTFPLVCGSIEQLPFANETFNLVTACRVLTHVSDLHGAMNEFGRITRTDGLLILSDISQSHNYTAVRIPTPKGDVHIETHKFTLDQLKDAAQRTNYWQIERIESIAYKNLIWQPEPEEYPTIDTSSVRPLFFYGILRRVAERP
jgi:ubiquinone/menaquinone biosynthesis C-methylase UbiE